MAWLPDMPEDLDAEKSLLATLAAPGMLAADGGWSEAHRALLACKAEYFVHPAHRALFEALSALFADGREVTSIALKAVLDAKKKLAAVGGIAGIIEILSAEEVQNPADLVTRLSALHKRRRLAVLGGRLTADAVDASHTADEVISGHAAEITKLAMEGAAPDIRFDGEDLPKINAGEPLADGGASGRKLAHFGLPAFDRAIRAAAGDLVIVTAKPGAGKSALLVQMRCVTARQGTPSLFVSLEMRPGTLKERTRAWLTSEAASPYEHSPYSPGAIDALNSPEYGLLSYWYHHSGAPWPKVEAVIRDSARLHGAKVVFLDYLQLIQKPALDKSATEASKAAAIAGSVKKLAEELGICIVAPCQLTKDTRSGEPDPSGMRDTSAWEDYADAIVTLWAKDAKTADGAGCEAEKAMYAAAPKVRTGPSGWRREVSFNGALSRFYEIERTASSRAPITY